MAPNSLLQKDDGHDKKYSIKLYVCGTYDKVYCGHPKPEHMIEDAGVQARRIFGSDLPIHTIAPKIVGWEGPDPTMKCDANGIPLDGVWRKITWPVNERLGGRLPERLYIAEVTWFNDGCRPDDPMLSSLILIWWSENDVLDIEPMMRGMDTSSALKWDL
jgi:hypothetical protein